MCKEEVILKDKFRTWRVWRKVGKKMVHNIRTSPKPMTTDEALKYFKTNVIQAVIE